MVKFYKNKNLKLKNIKLFILLDRIHNLVKLKNNYKKLLIDHICLFLVLNSNYV
jgi:hypothetical protein